MHRKAGRDSTQGDRTGPILLLFLLAGAFLPSVFIEFDLARLVSALADAMSRNAAPILVLLPSSEAPPAELQGLQGRGQLQVSTQIEGDSAARLPPPRDSRLVPAEPRSPRAVDWPPGPGQSPRAPPRPS